VDKVKNVQATYQANFLGISAIIGFLKTIFLLCFKKAVSKLEQKWQIKWIPNHSSSILFPEE
jgi:hypothetical protein